MKRLSFLVAALFALSACQEPPQPPTPPPAPDEPAEPVEPEAGNAAAAQAPPAGELHAAFAERIDAILAAEHRPPEHRARDVYRRPKETLAFFDVRPNATIVEITPGGAGWYAEILAPLVRDGGRYVGVVVDPATVGNEQAQAYYRESNEQLKARFAAFPEVFDQAVISEIDPLRPRLSDPETADFVLTFRNVHNWINAGSAEAMFSAFYDVLKPGGVLGIVEHRAAEGTEYDPKSGYVTESKVRELAQAAGFEFVGKSEINANVLDTKDYEAGVWTLPPSLRLGEKDKQRYLDIGESDRMTLKFRKPVPAEQMDELPGTAEKPVES